MDCHAQVNRFPNNLYKGYKSWDEADHAWKLYMREQEQVSEVQEQQMIIQERLMEMQDARATDLAETRNHASFMMMCSSKGLIIAVLAMAVCIQAYLLWIK
jgi:viroplasmin and RNaseH domain-containing protein